ncbi:MAG: polysaccharide biosynthesis protein [Acidobacteriaceae bacterium]|nr:polysaccharide biosynthesis protein [Acidobacteriaceae bacterium]
MGVRRHTLYNLGGSIIPILVGVVAVPIYLRLIGDARYGILAIVWLFLGYFGMFDPGITRAALFHIARLSNPGQEKERESVFWTALAVNLLFGLVGGIVLYFAAKPFFLSAFKMPESMRGEVIASLPWLAASVPISIVTGVLGGALQARDGFAAYNTIYSLNAIATQLAPLLVAYWYGPNLTVLICAVLITRTLGTIPSFAVLHRLLPLGVGGRFSRSRLRLLFIYGGWVMISNLINPILASLDRMLIGTIISAEAVAFYTVPFNLISRFSILPGAFATSLFPKLARSNSQESERMATEAVVALSAVMTPLFVVAAAALPVFMRFWVGESFAQHAAPIGVILLLGIWINGLAIIPFEQLQAMDRPDLTAKFHAIELIPFLGVLWAGLHFFGLIGAAWAWTLRVTVDALLLFLVAGKTPGWHRAIPGGALVLLAVFLSPSRVVSVRMGAEFLVLCAALPWAWQVSPLLRSALRRKAASPSDQPMA